MSGNTARICLRAVPVALVMSLGFTLSACDQTLTEIPKCDDANAKESVRKVIEENPNQQAKLKMLDLTNIKEVSYDEAKPERKCSATVTLNTGDENILFRFWFSSDKTVLVQVEPDSGDDQSDDSNGQ